MTKRKIRNVGWRAVKAAAWGIRLRNRRVKPTPVFDPLDAEQLEGHVRAMVNLHFDQAEGRIPKFIEENYRSFSKVMKRNVRGITDPLVKLRNAMAWPVRKLGGPDLSTTTWTEDKLRKIFVEELVQLGALEHSLATIHQQLGNAVDERLRELRSSPHLVGKTAKEVEAMILHHLGTANELADELKAALTAGAFAVASYLVAGKLKASLTPVGAAFAGSFYISQAGFFARLWYGFFGVPAWVGAVGAVVGAGVAVLVAPIIGGFVEYGLNHRRSLETRMQSQLNAVRKTLLDGKSDDEHHIESLLTGLLRQRDLAMDFVKFVTQAVA